MHVRGAVACLAAMLLAAVLLATACAATTAGGGAKPSASGAPSNAATNDAQAAGPITAAELNAAGINSASLVTLLHVESKTDVYDATLLGAYADPARLVLFVHVSPADIDAMAVSYSDGQDDVNASSGSIQQVPGDYVMHVDAGPRAGPDRIAHLLVHLHLDLPTSNPAAPTPQPAWKFDLQVQRSLSLPGGAPFQLGSLQVTITTLEVTPSTLHVRAQVAGASGNDLSDPTQPDLLTAVDAAGARLRGVATGGEIASGGYQVDYQWMRPAPAGKYTLRFQWKGTTHTVTVNAPAAVAI